jgi:competence protein ComEA
VYNTVQKEEVLSPQQHARLLLIILFVFSALSLQAAAKKDPPSRPINVNVATIKELQELPGVGVVTAKAIVQFRQKSGPFKRVEDLLAVRGISEGKLAKMRPYVTVGGPPAAPSRPVLPAKQ